MGWARVLSLLVEDGWSSVKTNYLRILPQKTVRATFEVPLGHWALAGMFLELLSTIFTEVPV